MNHNRPETSRRETAEPKLRSGASTAGVTANDRLRGWLLHHREMAAEAWRRFMAAPLSSAMTSLVIAIALALPAALYVGLANFQQAVAGWDGQPQISVFMDKRARPQALQQFAGQLEADPLVSEVQEISPEQALAEFEAQSGFGDVLDGLQENPLPTVFLLRPASADQAELEKLAQRLRDSALTDSVVLDVAWVQRLAQLTALAQRLLLGFAALLAVGVVLVMVNTIRLHIESRRDEILVVKLVGATNAFVRRPFLYSGFWYGLTGGLVAWGLVMLGLALLSGPAQDLAQSYQSSFELRGMGLATMLLLVGGAAILGLLGAWVAVMRHISGIEPR